MGEERQYWLWVTRPDYYLDEDGNDREDLDPDSGVDGWWTCHKDTKKGDLVLLWRTSPKKDIGYLIQAESDAYSIADENDHGWDYACDYQTLYKFNHPINVKDLRKNPYFDEWGPLRCSFQRSSFKISLDYWSRLNQLAAASNPGYLDFIDGLQRIPLAEGIRLEEELEEALASDLRVLNNFGHNLELYVDSATSQSGRQFICKGNGGRIDLLCFDQKQRRYVVIELKNVRASQNTFGQISNYMGWVQDRIAKSTPVIGIVISRGYDTRFESALKITDRISHINVEQLGFGIAPSKKAQEFADLKPKENSKKQSTLKARSIKSREARSWLKKGNAFSDQEQFDDAISCYDKVIEINPKNKWGWINKGVALGKLMKPEEAISCYDKVIALYPMSSDAWCNKGHALIVLNTYDAAIAAFDKAIDIKPKYADAWNGKGLVLVRLEKYDEAIQAYDKAIKIRPKFDLVWNNKGWALIDQSRYEESITCFDKAIELDDESTWFQIGKGVALNELGKHEEALEAYNKAIEIDPSFTCAWISKAETLIKLGRKEECLQASEKAIGLDHKLAIAWNNKGEALKLLGRTTEADEAFAKAKELGYEG